MGVSKGDTRYYAKIVWKWFPSKQPSILLPCLQLNCCPNFSCKGSQRQLEHVLERTPECFLPIYLLDNSRFPNPLITSGSHKVLKSIPVSVDVGAIDGWVRRATNLKRVCTAYIRV